LRKTATPGEKRLWQKIRKKQLGFEFHRQVPINQFIVDFYCPELMLAIEIDGASHDSRDAEAKDLERRAIIESFGVSFLRFREEEVVAAPEKIVRKIEGWIAKNKG